MKAGGRLAGSLVAAVALGGAACSPTANHAQGPSNSSPVVASSPPTTTWPATFQPVGASFVSPTQGWVVGSSGCRECLGVEATSDGTTWTKLPAPDVSLGGAGPSVTDTFFVDALDGYLYGPGLQVTRDGGKTWSAGSVVAVLGMASADGYVFALSQVPDKAAAGLLRARPGGDSWTAVPLPTMAPSTAEGSVPEDRIVGDGDTLVLLEQGFHGPGRTASDEGALWSSTDGGGTWNSRSMPCTTEDGGASTVSIANGHPNAWLIDCYDNRQSSGAQQTQHHLYGTADGGATWVRLADPSHTGLPDQLADNGAGHAFLTVEGAGRNQLMGSFDGGRSWTTVLTIAPGFTGWADLQFLTPLIGYVVGPTRFPPDHLYRTADGGRTWAVVAMAAAG